MQLSFWNEFIKHADQEHVFSPVLFSLLKQIKPTGYDDGIVTLQCENQGVKIYLEKKLHLIEKPLVTFLNKQITLVLTLKEKSITQEAPLLQYQPPKEDFYVKSGLHLKYTFENFAVSSSNQVAFAAAQAVAKSPGISYNPLFLYGGVGVGKTHLAQAAARVIIDDDNSRKVLFCPSDKFTNELIEAIRMRTTPKFRYKYRHLSLLIVDDIQFIAGKVSVQEEFFHTFNDIVSAGGQVILTSDRPPSDIKNLEDRLRSRFSGGLIVDIQPPDFELRAAILLIKAKEKNIEIDMEAAQVIAETITDGRTLEGTLLSIYAKTLGRKDRIDLEVVDAFFQERSVIKQNKVTYQDVIKSVCLYYNIKPLQIKSSTRVEEIAMARQIIMYILRKELNMKLEEIAALLKRKDHTTIIHGVEKINTAMIKNPLLKQEIDRIISTLRQST